MIESSHSLTSLNRSDLLVISAFPAASCGSRSRYCRQVRWETQISFSPSHPHPHPPDFPSPAPLIHFNPFHTFLSLSQSTLSHSSTTSFKLITCKLHDRKNCVSVYRRKLSWIAVRLFPAKVTLSKSR